MAPIKTRIIGELEADHHGQMVVLSCTYSNAIEQAVNSSVQPTRVNLMGAQFSIHAPGRIQGCRKARYVSH